MARKVRDDCKAAGVPFWFKQWGEWAPLKDNWVPPSHWTEATNGKPLLHWDRDKNSWCKGYNTASGIHIVRVGKKTAGSLLDEREWKELPK